MHVAPTVVRRRSAVRATAVATALAATFATVLATSCGSDAGAEPLRESSLVLDAYEDGNDYKYRAIGTVDVRAGDRVTIEVRNTGSLIHDLAVIHPDGSTVAAMDPIAAGATGTLVVDLEDPGYYRLNCNVDNHLTQHGMQAVIDVTNPDGTSING